MRDVAGRFAFRPATSPRLVHALLRVTDDDRADKRRACVNDRVRRRCGPMSDSRWTPADIPDLHGVSAVVTGANSGLGLQTTIGLARAGALVVMGCRESARREA